MLRGESARLSRPTTKHMVVVPRSDYPSPNAAMDRLFDVFPDKYPFLVAESNNDWTFEFAWPRHLLETVDPFLTKEAQDCFGVELSDLDKYVELHWCNGIPFVFSMFHSSALLAPSNLMAKGDQLPEVVIHVDAHHDLGPSLLGPSSYGVLVNEAFGITCQLSAPESVDRAIDAGFVNKANFLSAYLLATYRGRLVHVERRQPGDQFALWAMTHNVKVGVAATTLHTIEFGRGAATNNWHLVESPELPPHLSLHPGQTVWLDVDLDAFCNRFDGDSDRWGHPKEDDEVNSTLRHVNAFLTELSAVDWLGNISAVSVAASPSFFPSEYWGSVIPMIRTGIANLL